MNEIHVDIKVSGPPMTGKTTVIRHIREALSELPSPPRLVISVEEITTRKEPLCQR